jgi:hypothetical protein
MSAVPIAQTGNAASKAILNTEFPGFLNRCSNWSANKTQAAIPLWAAKALSPNALKTGAGEGIRTLDPNLGKIRIYEIFVLNQLFIKLLKNPNTIRTFAAPTRGRII